MKIPHRPIMNQRPMNTRAYNSQSYLNQVKAMKMNGRAANIAGRKMNMTIPRMRNR
jgi:hypothetical protein